MPRKKSHITITDQFCGAGGSSQGARNFGIRAGGGVEIKLALNHWKLAIETHNTNFPNTDHDCTDISASDPRRYPSTDILITSPECTNHSLAKGQKVVQKQMDLFKAGVMDAAAERSRATMWDVCRFAEYHAYNIIIVENVVDARKWVMFDVWLQAMYTLGYEHKCVYINSMHCHPTPQSRDRMYIVFWKRGNKRPMLDYTPVAHCSKCCKDVHAIQTWKNANKKFGKYKQQYVYCCGACTTVVEPYYYAAFNCIDWSDTGTRIGDRKKPLAPNTMIRANFGLDKYGKEPYIIHAAYSEHARGVVRSVTDPAFTQTTFASQALINPFIVNDQHSTGVNFRVKSVMDKVDTIASVNNLKLITPFIIKNEHSHAEISGKVKPVTSAFQTQTTRQSMGIVTPPAILINKGQSKTKKATDALPGLTSKPHVGLLTNEAWNAFIMYNRRQNPTAITDALQTVATLEQLSLLSYQQPKIEDCYYRMLKPKEIKLAMAFDHDYVVLGSGKDQVKQLGNAVTPPAMEWLVEQCIKSLS